MAYGIFLLPLQTQIKLSSMMKRIIRLFPVVLSLLLAVSCGEKKKSDDIITTKAEKPQIQEPIRMQEYKQVKDIKWLNKNYQVEVCRQPADSLRKVKDEVGQEFVDNHITLRIIRADGTIFFNRMFTKAAFEAQLDEDYRKTGILEGFVFDKVDGNQLVFAASVSHPQTDEYIPFVVTVSNFGDVGIRRDTHLDTYASDEDEV